MDPEILEHLIAPSLPFTLPELAAILLPVTGTLLGLVYAGLIYWFQGALERLKYSRTFLEDILSAHGKVLLDLLVGASLIGLFAYFELGVLTSLAFWLFATLLFLDLLRVTAERGYFETLFSTKSIPARYGRLRAFLRQLWNAGPLNWWAAFVPFALTVLYPLWINVEAGHLFSLTDVAVSVVLLATTAISLLQIRSLLVEAIAARKTSEERLQSANDTRAQHLEEPEITWDRQKIELEQRVLMERLSSIRVHQWSEVPRLAEATTWDSSMLHETPVLRGPAWVKEDGSCHLNIYIPLFLSDVETIDFMLSWGRRMLQAMASSKSTVTRYALSFFRNDAAGENPHFGMVRASKGDVLAAMDKSLSDREFIRAMPGRYFPPGVV